MKKLTAYAMDNQRAQKGLVSLMVPLWIALFFLFWGLLIFFIVGDRGPGSWFYGTQNDVPGQSIYSTERSRVFPGSGPQPYVEMIRPQHVDGSVNPVPENIPEELIGGKK